MTLFDLNNPPCQRHSETSREAAASIATHLARLETMVLDFIRKAGDKGCIDHQIAAGLELLPETARARRVRLVELGLVKDSGRKRLSPSGRAAGVWVAV